MWECVGWEWEGLWNLDVWMCGGVIGPKVVGDDNVPLVRNTSKHVLSNKSMVQAK